MFTLAPKQLDYVSVNKHLEAKHPNLSSAWFSFGYNEAKTEAYVMYEISESLPVEEVIVTIDGTVTASDRLLQEMEKIG